MQVIQHITRDADGASVSTAPKLTRPSWSVSISSMALRSFVSTAYECSTATSDDSSS
jgi:hypothetical protein